LAFPDFVYLSSNWGGLLRFRIRTGHRPGLVLRGKHSWLDAIRHPNHILMMLYWPDENTKWRGTRMLL